MKKEKKTRDAEATQRKILKAATKEFSKKGFDGARVDRIASLAGVNKQMIYHYFGSKDALFTTVLENAYSDIREKETTLDLDRYPADEAILHLTEFTWRYYREHPEFIQLLNSENQLEARHIKASAHAVELNVSYMTLAARLIERGQREGNVRDDIDPMQLNINIAALGFFYLINRHTLSTIFRHDLTSEEAFAERLVVIKDVIARWIHPVVPSPVG